MHRVITRKSKLNRDAFKMHNTCTHTLTNSNRANDYKPNVREMATLFSTKEQNCQFIVYCKWSVLANTIGCVCWCLEICGGEGALDYFTQKKFAISIQRRISIFVVFDQRNVFCGSMARNGSLRYTFSFLCESFF